MNTTVLVLAGLLTCLWLAGGRVPGWLVLGAWTLGLLFDLALGVVIAGTLLWALAQHAKPATRGPNVPR